METVECAAAMLKPKVLRFAKRHLDAISSGPINNVHRDKCINEVTIILFWALFLGSQQGHTIRKHGSWMTTDKPTHPE